MAWKVDCDLAVHKFMIKSVGHSLRLLDTQE